MKPSKKFFDLVKQWESFRSKPYLCPAGIPTIGYGSTRYPTGEAVRLTDPPITEPYAIAMLEKNLELEYIPAVNRYVKVPINQNQFDALLDFVYNAGAQNFRTSTLLRKLNAKDYDGAAEEFKKWVFAAGKKINGLVNRREAERKLFMEESWA